jgi:hypothetical protein
MAMNDKWRIPMPRKTMCYLYCMLLEIVLVACAGKSLPPVTTRPPEGGPGQSTPTGVSTEMIRPTIVLPTVRLSTTELPLTPVVSPTGTLTPRSIVTHTPSATTNPTTMPKARVTTPAKCGLQPGTLSNNRTGSKDEQIEAQGTVILCAEPDQREVPEAMVDLDHGTWAAGERSDLEYSESLGSMVFDSLKPIHRALLGPASKTEPELAGCLRSRSDLSKIPNGSLFVGASFCVLTNEGRMAQVKVDQLYPLGYGTLQISFVTWSNIVSIPATP